ncbi:MAG: alpha-amylase family glycosyl hydrolase, partial [Bacteroidota bacterium]
MPTEKQPIALVKDDPWLAPYEQDIRDRMNRALNRMAEIAAKHGSLEAFASAYTYFGINYSEAEKGWWYREWAPAAQGLSLVGDFNQWDENAHMLQRSTEREGVWEIFLADTDLPEDFGHASRIKVRVFHANGRQMDRIPAYIRRAVQDPNTLDFSGQIWSPAEPFKWTDEGYDAVQIGTPFIYESHTGMAQEKEGLGTYREFADEILPRIKALGYNSIQLMAVHEHPYYGSFGYHVSNFFAPSSRFGTPEDLKYLVNTAHNMGIAVIMDIVHSHAVKNLAEGLNLFDGS